jgi:hypothetical protein
MKKTVSPVPPVGNASRAAGLHATCDLGHRSLWSTSAWIYSSVTVDVS